MCSYRLKLKVGVSLLLARGDNFEFYLYDPSFSRQLIHICRYCQRFPFTTLVVAAELLSVYVETFFVRLVSIRELSNCYPRITPPPPKKKKKQTKQNKNKQTKKQQQKKNNINKHKGTRHTLIYSTCF